MCAVFNTYFYEHLFSLMALKKTCEMLTINIYTFAINNESDNSAKF